MRAISLTYAPSVLDADGICASQTTSGAANAGCAECEAGKYKPSSGGSCLSCPDHATSPLGSVVQAACVCKAGYVESAGGCAACGPGTYHVSGSSTCAACRGNSTSVTAA